MSYTLLGRPVDPDATWVLRQAWVPKCPENLRAKFEDKLGVRVQGSESDSFKKVPLPRWT